MTVLDYVFLYAKYIENLSSGYAKVILHCLYKNKIWV